MRGEWGAVLALGTAQTLAWGGSYYLPAMLAAPIARDLGLSQATIFAVFSAALVCAASIGPAAGRWIDRHGGRGLHVAAALIFALGLLLLGMARGLAGLILAWAVIGLGMGVGLYEAAFATLARLFGTGARRPITGITLMAGFASTLSWPLTAWLDGALGWRGACFVWAVLIPLVNVPLLLLLLPKPPPAPPSAASAGGGEPAAAPPPRSALVLLAFIFAVSGFGAAAMGAHLPGLLAAAGADAAAVVLAGALVGPAQVAARLLEFGLLQRLSPLRMAIGAHLLHPIGAGALLLLGAPAAPFLALLHGAGNGLLTIARGSLPLLLFGPAGYGARLGWLAVPARFSGAAAPFLFGLLLEAAGAAALCLTGGLYLAAAARLARLARQRP
ncbi:MAG: MFS transporter [Rhodovarius sp.]|nr:MFS transporter [Rhodovarius sp.]